MFKDYRFEWDPQKNEASLRKHGLSFERARTIWDDEGGSAITSATNQRPVGSSSQGSDHASTCLQW